MSANPRWYEYLNIEQRSCEALKGMPGTRKMRDITDDKHKDDEIAIKQEAKVIGGKAQEENGRD